MKQTLHQEFYDFRERVWKALEELVHTGCDYIGEFPTANKESCFIIHGIKANPNYSICPQKKNEKDIVVKTNKITVIYEALNVSGSKMNRVKLEKEIIPNLLGLQELSTYLSGGFSVYNIKD